MPRLPVDGKKVIEHRITFGTLERQIMQDLQFAYSTNKIATPIVSLMSDVSGMIVLVGIIEVIYGSSILTGGEETMAEVIQKLYLWNETRLAESEQVALGGYNPGGVVGGIINFIELIGDIQRQAFTGSTEGFNG